ncbi:MULTISPECIES: DUF1385 domain-containing protein [unclassified Niallia]|uniref:DUF1385 domain-containing protein n=1 Tax=unclassified Niallia TaxID=2837522 RepID=UPI0020539C38|nr:MULTISPECIES: DUF1385 domain-containing protein [unclassified Niallia]MDL0435556.1 DUF1385 domain-containing protein [Niallia sp. SS-2023]UPO88129.1 DUF1385 domain-containing protein [Niallia sp. Man26]
MNYGGKALFNGVKFHSKNVSVKSIRKDGKITTTHQIKGREEEDIDDFDIDKYLKRVPIVRGMWFFITSFLDTWKSFLSILAFGFTFLFVMSKGSWSIGGLSAAEIETAVILLIILYLLIYKLTPLGKYHAAEHMAANCFNRREDLTLKNVQSQSRISEDCHLNLVIFIALFSVTVWLIPYSNQIDGIVVFFVVLALAYELYIIRNKHVKKLLRPIYFIGYGLQYLLFTTKPAAEHLETAIQSLKKMAALQESMDKEEAAKKGTEIVFHPAK